MKVKCGECGNEFVMEGNNIFRSENLYPISNCLVCHFKQAMPLQKTLSTADLETLLKTLLEMARTLAIPSQQIVDLLRSELEFEVELAQAGRHFMVQIIDLGFHEANMLPLPLLDNRMVLRNHGVV